MFFQWFNSLKIAQKILIGYGATIGVAMIGIGTGYQIANYYDYQANILMEDAIDELLLLNRLENNLLLVRNSQLQAITYIEKSNLDLIESRQLLSYIVEVEQIWSEFNEEHGHIEAYEPGESLEEKKQTEALIEAYRKLEPWLINIKQIVSSQENKITASEINTQNFYSQLKETNQAYRSPLNQFIKALDVLYGSVVIEYRDAISASAEAESLQLQIIISSLLLSVLLATILGFAIIRTVVRPLEKVTQIIKEVTQTTNFKRQVPITTSDEVGFLANSFNQLIGLVQQLLDKQSKINQKLARYNQTLEQKVQQRTETLSQTLQQLQTAQAEIIQSEKMAALGHLVAGIAHEVNTPLGAIQASISNISNNLEQSFQTLPQLFQQLSPEQLNQFCLLLDWATQPKKICSTREERQLRRKLKQSLIEEKIEKADQLANNLSQMSITESLEPILPLLKSSSATLVLNSANQLATIQRNSKNISMATERASKIVFALKTYIHQENSDSKVRCDLRESIDLVLILYQNQIKRGIEVIKNYESIPEISCYAEELTQVWSNLIGNAIQAMNYEGTLKIGVKTEDNYVVVEIEDSGSGISPEIQAKIFEPFFTTKAPGEGSGLGLHLVQQIVEKHQGMVKFSSQVGYTRFSIWLPII